MNYPLCNKPPKNLNFFINSIVHVFILLTILASFFFIYVSNLAKNNFHSELADVVNDNLGPVLQKADKDQYIKKLLQNMEPTLSQSIEYFNTDSQATTIQNKWLMYSTIGIIFGLVLTMIIILIIIKIFCRKIPFWSIIKENMILFSLIGTVEVVFFLFIAKNFVPTKPSLVLQTVLNTIKKDFNVSNS